jgi:hypothetical protein
LARAGRELASLPTLEQPPHVAGARPHTAGLAAAIVRANASGAPAALEPPEPPRAPAIAPVESPPMAPVTEQPKTEQTLAELARDGALDDWRSRRINETRDELAGEAPGLASPAALSASEVRVREP